MAALKTEGNKIAFQGGWCVTNLCMVLLSEICPTESLLNYTRITNAFGGFGLLLQAFEKVLKAVSMLHSVIFSLDNHTD